MRRRARRRAAPSDSKAVPSSIPPCWFRSSPGAGAQAVVATVFAIWGDTQIFGSSIAWFCAIYGLTVWTPARRFAFGLAFVVSTDLAAPAGPHATLHQVVPFAVVTGVV